MTPGVVLHWFDFICPFCYIAQDRNRILCDAGVAVIDLPVQIHPEIGPGGVPAPPRNGPVYDQLAEAARDAGFELNWPSRIPCSRPALAAAEAVRTHQPESHQAFSAAVCRGHFALGQDIEDPAVIAACAEGAGVDPLEFASETTSGAAEDELRHAERQARAYRVTGTPSWLVADRLIVGLRSRAFFTALGHALTSADLGQLEDGPDAPTGDRCDR
jgi:predicted DsbA family dithiol-disulfide isomerase